MNAIIESFKNAEKAGYEWLKGLSVMSVGALTILVSMMPDDQPAEPERYFLAATWVLLVVCIPFSLAASYLPVVQEKHLGFAAMDLSQAPEGAQNFSGSPEVIKNFKLLKKLKFSLYISLISFYLSFVSLAVYACLSIL